MGDKKFRISRNKLMVSVLIFLGGFIITMLIESGVSPDFNENILMCFVIALGAALVAALISAVLVKEVYIKILEDGFELQKGKNVTKYSFSDFAGSDVTRHYMNGIYYGTTREISVKGPNGKKKKINANNLSKASFAELVTYLGKSSYLERHDVEVSAEYFNERHEFRIPNGDLIKANKNKAVRYVAISAVLLVIGIVMFVFYLVNGLEMKENAAFFTIMMFAGLGSVILMLFEGIPALLLCRKVRNMPERIFFDGYSLGIGDMNLDSNYILNISMVPPKYNIMSRDMIIIMKDNTKYKYNFGKNEFKSKTTYSDYEGLFGTVELWCIVNGINFMNILG